MNILLTENLVFKGLDYSKTILPKGIYENCTFLSCNFMNVDLSGFTFENCIFTECDLSLVKLGSTSLQDVKFLKSKLLGLRFEDCKDFLFSVNFDECHLNLSTFYQSLLKKTIFKDCYLHEVDFTESNLANARFINCDLTRAIFERANLEKTDFTSSYNFTIDPEKNKIRKAKFSKENVAGLLTKYDIIIE